MNLNRVMTSSRDSFESLRGTCEKEPLHEALHGDFDIEDQRRTRSQHILKWALTLSICVNIVQLALTCSTTRYGLGAISHMVQDPWRLTYCEYCDYWFKESQPQADARQAPADVAVEYEVKHFTAGFGKESTMYMNNGSVPTDELDQRWKDLYESKRSCPPAYVLPPTDDMSNRLGICAHPDGGSYSVRGANGPNPWR